MKLDDLLKTTVEKDASDLHLTVGRPPMIRIYGELVPMEDGPPLTNEQTTALTHSIISDAQKKRLEEELDLDLSYSIDGLCRFRVNVYWQQGNLGLAIRVIPSNIPDPDSIGLSREITNLGNLRNGLVLVTGPTGSGKSTTLAAMIDKINAIYKHHILTFEDPIEFVYKHKQSMINQREVGQDTKTFASGLKHALREDPDVILVGELRDLDTITNTLTIAETGHLAFATLHTNDAAQTIDRVIAVFPPHQQQQIRVMLSVVLKAVICQQLIPRADGKGRVAAREILFADMAVSNLIREGNTHQVYSSIQTGGKKGMQTMDACVAKLFWQNVITREAAVRAMPNPDQLDQYQSLAQPAQQQQK